MHNKSNNAQQIKQVIAIRPSKRINGDCGYVESLRKYDIHLLQYSNLKAAFQSTDSSCRVGLLIFKDEEDLRLLEASRGLLLSKKILWVALIDRELMLLHGVRHLIREHMFNFIITPAEPQQIALMLRQTWGMALMLDAQLHGQPEQSAAHNMEGMVGKSPVMRRLYDVIRKVGGTDASLLIDGESGTGKELVASSVHRLSARKDAPFVAVNCGAIAPQLFQSELFGYEKGAFTGASQRRIGRIEAAQGGTLFLDEIGDMPLEMQVNLLRFLQEKTIVRVGGMQSLPMDVRIIAATNINMEEAVRLGNFREDLYFRINVVRIAVPRLVDRIEDIEDIAQAYFDKFSRINNKSLRGFSSAAKDALVRHDWPGNVRELVNRVQRAVVMAEGRYIQPEDLGFEHPAQNPEPILSLEMARAKTEREMIRRALTQSRNNVIKAARMLGISRVTLHRLICKHKLQDRSFLNNQADMFDQLG